MAVTVQGCNITTFLHMKVLHDMEMTESSRHMKGGKVTVVVMVVVARRVVPGL